MLVGLLLLSLAYNWYYLTGGFHADDLLLINLLREDPLRFSRWCGLWSTFDIPGLMSMWWADPDIAGAFCRPLTSLVFEGSIRVFGETALPLHLLSIVLQGLVAGGLYLFVRRLTGRSLLAILVGVIYLSCEDHSLTVGWIATVADILCLAFVLLALNAHVAWLQRRRPAALVVTLMALLLSLGFKESAVVAPVLVVLATLAFPRGTDDTLPSLRPSVLWARAVAALKDPLSWAPAVMVFVVYLTLYKTLSLGEMNNLGYIDPLSRPGAYLGHLVVHLPVMWLATVTPVFPSLVMFMPEALAPLALGGLIVFPVWLLLLWPLRHRALALWGMAAYLLALLPQLGTDASERLLYVPWVGVAVLLGCMVVQIGPLARRVLPGTRPGKLARAGGWLMLLGVVVPGAALSAFYPYIMLPSLVAPERQALTALPHIEERRPEHVLVLNTGGAFMTLYASGVLEYHQREHIDLRLLSSCNGVLSVERLPGNSFVIRTDRAGWHSNMFARILLSRPVAAGRVYDIDLFQATLVELTPDGNDVLAVRFDLKRPLDDPSLLFLYWDGSGFESLDLASLAPGASLELADTSDIWAAML
ncbi:MAG: glycosyltransferase family 39 protein [Planctomycetota bacterium]